MGCHTWLYKDFESYNKQIYNTTEMTGDTIFRSSKYHTTILRNFEESKKFVENNLDNIYHNYSFWTKKRFCK